MGKKYRVNVPAKSKEEAERKALEFFSGKLKVVSATRKDDTFEAIMKALGLS